jgi:hypothetical protein
MAGWTCVVLDEAWKRIAPALFASNLKGKRQFTIELVE